MPKKKADTEATVKAPKKRRKIVISKKAPPAGVIQIDDVLRKANHVQVDREMVKFKVAIEDAPVVENILRDLGLVVSRFEHPSYVSYEVRPGEPVLEGSNALENLEEMSDEIHEDGQIFD